MCRAIRTNQEYRPIMSMWKVPKALYLHEALSNATTRTKSSLSMYSSLSPDAEMSTTEPPSVSHGWSILHLLTEPTPGLKPPAGHHELRSVSQTPPILQPQTSIVVKHHNHPPLTRIFVPWVLFLELPSIVLLLWGFPVP